MVIDVKGQSLDFELKSLFSKMFRIGLESDNSLQNFSAVQILLGNIIRIRGDDPISLIISNVTFVKARWDSDRVLMSQTVDQMVQSYDIDVFWWNHDLILTAVIKLLYHMVVVNKLSKNSMTITNDINIKIKNNRDDLPAYFIEGSNTLNRVSNYDKREVSLNTYFDSIRNVHISF